MVSGVLVSCIGEYCIEVTYFGHPVAGSPFTAKAWDMNKVNVSNVVQGRVGLQSSFNSEYTTGQVLTVRVQVQILEKSTQRV